MHPSVRKRALVAALAASTAMLSVTAVTGTATASTGGGGHPLGAHNVNAPAHSLGTEEPSGHIAGHAADGVPAGIPAKGRYGFLIKLKTVPAMKTFQTARASGDSVREAGLAAAQHKSAITAAQTKLITSLPSKSTVLYRLSNVLTAVAVTTDVKNYHTLVRLPNVAAVYPIAPKRPDNSYAVPLQKAPAAWGGTTGDLGEGVVVADIDTGLDYTHKDFGGPGTAAAYETAYASSTTAPAVGSYDPNKFDAKDSYDLVGNTYNADDTGQYGPFQPVPQPDPNPLDCAATHGGDGHGTHTAGTIAGFGVAGNGSTYGVDGSGAVDPTKYNESTPFSSMKIGPGMAPGATLISYRVFGCAGSSDEISHAIDMAMDPNGDGNPADHVNVINMSLGSDYGASDDGDSITSEAAVDEGITVAVASGNAGDVPDIGGSPGDAPKVLTVAASEDAQSIVDGTDYTIDGTSHTGADGLPSERSISYPWATAPDLHGNVVPLLTASGQLDTACSALTADQKTAVAGKIVLVKWTDDNLECGSVLRSGNIRKGGGIGFIFGSNLEAFDAGITGDSGATPGIPGVEVNLDAKNILEGALGMANDATNGTAAKDVEITGTETNAVTQLFPADDNKVASFSSRGVHAAGDLKPDVSAVGTTVFSANVGTGSDGQTMSGTSMATPMVAGLAALVIKAHPDWETDYGSAKAAELVKADIMNTADQGVYVNGSAAGGLQYAPNRIGAGRIDAQTAVANQVLAFDEEDAGTVSASFGPLEVPVATTNFVRTKTLRVMNTGDTDETYTPTYQPAVEMPGVDYKLGFADNGDGTMTIPAHGFGKIVVTLEIDDPTKLVKSVDPSYQSKDPQTGTFVDGSGTPVETLGEASGDVVLTPTGNVPALRVPVYAAPRPTSALQAAPTLKLNAQGTASPQTWGYGVAAGSDDLSTDVFSLAAGFELQYKSGVAPTCEQATTGGCTSIKEDSGADLKYVGTTSDYPLYNGQKCPNFLVGGQDQESCAMEYIAIAAQGANSSPVGRAEYDIYVDTDGDGLPDFVVYNTAIGLSAQSAEPLYVSEVEDLDSPQGPSVIDDELINGRLGSTDTALYDSDVMVMPISLAVLKAYGVSPSSPTIHYGIESWGADSNSLVDSFGIDPDTGDMRGALPVNVYQPGVSVTEDDGSDPTFGPLVDDQDAGALAAAGISEQVKVDPNSYAADGGLGMLYVHFHNAVGSKAQVVNVQSGTKLAFSPASVSTKVGSTVHLTVSASDPLGLSTPAGRIVVKDPSGKIVSAGTAPLHVNYRAAKVGSVKLTATFSPTDAASSAATAAATVRIAKATPKLALTASTKSVKVGKSFTAKVTFTKSGGIAPTGKVTVKYAGTTIGSKAVASNGTVTFTVKAKKKGSFKLTASFGGDANYTSASASAVTIKVS